MANFLTLPAYRVPGPIDFSPVDNALVGYSKGMELQRQGDVARAVGNALTNKNYAGATNAAIAGGDTQTGMAVANLKMKQDEAAAAAEQRERQRVGAQAQAVLELPDGDARRVAWQRVLDSNPRMVEALTKNGQNPADHNASAAFVLREALGVQDPLKMELARAQIAKEQGEAALLPRKGNLLDAQAQAALANAEKDRAEAANGGVRYGLNPTYMVDEATGKVVLGQLSNRGGIVPVKTPDGMAVAPGVEKMDAGTYWSIRDKRTGQEVGQVAKDLSGAAFEREQGEAAGKAAADLPRVENNANEALKAVRQIRQHPGRSHGFRGWFAEKTGGIPNTDQRGFVNLLKQAKGKAFLEAFNSLRGGGQITEAEGQKATEALVRMDAAQTEGDFLAALADFEDIIRKGLDVARERARRPGSGGVTSSAPTQSRPDPLGIR